MTREEAIEVLRTIEVCGFKDKSKKYFFKDVTDALDMAIKALELVNDFEKAQIITEGRLNGRTQAYKCGLADGQRQTRWIPCSERLPDKLNDVLVTFHDCPNEYDVAYLRTTFNESYKKSGAENEWVSSMGETTYADYEVDAWMPLPHPYKGESEGW